MSHPRFEWIRNIVITIRRIHVLVLVTMTLSIQWLGSSSVGPSTVPSYYPRSLFIPLCTYPTLQPPLCNPLGSRSSQISVWNFQQRPFRFPLFATPKMFRYIYDSLWNLISISKLNFTILNLFLYLIQAFFISIFLDIIQFLYINNFPTLKF